MAFMESYTDEMRINGAPEYNPPEDSEEEREEEELFGEVAARVAREA